MKIPMYKYNSYLCLSLFLSFLIISLIIYAWKNRRVLGARSFLFTLFLVEIWIAAQALEMAALDLPTKLIWANIQYIPIILTPASYLYLTLRFTSRDKWLKKRWLPFLLLIVPLVFNILLWTNHFHELIRQNITLDISGFFPTIGKTYGPLFWVFAAYNYAITVITFLNLINGLKEKAPIYKKQILFLIAALLLPVASNLLQISGLNPFHVDPTPASFGLSALMICLGIFRYRLFDIIPIAHSIIIQEMRTGIIVLDHESRILDINPAARKMLNFKSEHLIGRSINEELDEIPDLVQMYHEDTDIVREIAVIHGNTQNYYEICYTQIKNSKKESIGRLLQIYDLTERKIAEEVIEHAAFYDSLTGLTNRNHFEVVFSQELTHAKIYGDFLAAAFLDLDNFKTINDTYGHDIGDKVLCETAKRLKGVLRETDIISRYGGDEFAIVLPHIGNDEIIRLMENKLSKAMEQSFEFSEGSLQIKASIGFSVFPRDGESIEVLLKKADKAMYHAKNSDINNYCIYKE